MVETLEQITRENECSKYTQKEQSDRVSLHNMERYAIFSEQYLEKPYTPQSPQAFLTLTVCTVKGVPLIDDPDWDDR